MPNEADGLGSLSLEIGALVLLLWGAAWVLRRIRPGAAAAWGARDCAIIRSLALGPRERLVVVQVGAKHLVVGIGAAAVSLLCELDQPLPPIASPNAKFGEAIRSAFGKWWAG